MRALILLVAAGLTVLPVHASAQSAGAPRLTRSEQEQFLHRARVVATRRAGKGVTGVLRATLDDGVIRHDASIQTVNLRKNQFRGKRGIELDFRDYWGYNVAAYRLAILLDLDVVPPSIARSHHGDSAAFTWWVDDVLMDESERTKDGVKPPDPVRWNRQVYTMRLFDELIANIDRNQGNMIIDANWKLWLIDHTRAFRLNRTLSTPTTVRGCEKQLFARLRALTQEMLEPELRKYLTSDQIRAILVRRDLLVAHLESLGPGALYEERSSALPAGASSAP